MYLHFPRLSIIHRCFRWIRIEYIIEYSEDFSQSYWSKSESTVTLDSSTISPNGSAGVYKLAPTTANANHTVQKTKMSASLTATHEVLKTVVPGSPCLLPSPLVLLDRLLACGRPPAQHAGAINT